VAQLVKKFHYFLIFCVYTTSLGQRSSYRDYGTGCTSRGSNPGKGQDFSLLQNFQFGMKLNVRLYLVPSLRMSGAIPLYRVLVGKPEGKRPLWRPRRRWEDNIKMDHQELGWGAWTGSSWLRIGTDGGHL
jgi:hypothetical protein